MVPFFITAQSKKVKKILKSNKLEVVVRDFDTNQPISFDTKSNDRLNLSGEFENALFMAGFNIVSSRVAQEILEYNNPLNENTETVKLQKYTKTKSVYVISVSGDMRRDTGCGGMVPRRITGRIIDLLNDGQLVGTFSFSQTNFEGKCAQYIAEAVAIKLKEASVIK